MIRIPKVTMTMRDLDRLKCIQGLIDGQLKQTAVAARLGLTTRQVRRLVRRYELQGPIGLISRLRDRPSNRRLKTRAADHAFGILRSEVVSFVGVASSLEYFEATHRYRKRYGKPLGFYSDKASVFRVNKKTAAAGKGHTQFGRALYELNIDGMCANTPAAKGRVERA